jgi:hypothetical protein
MTRYKAVAALLGAVLMASCEKNAVQDITLPQIPSSAIRFFNFGLGAPGVNFYVDDGKFTAISSSTCSPTPTDTVQQRVCRETGGESTTGVVFGGVGSAGLYGALEPGQRTLTGRIAATTDKNLVIASVAATIDPSKRYSFYMSGPYNTTTKTVDAFVVEDPLPAIDWTVANVRFVNAIYNSSPMTMYARDSTTKIETPIGGDVAYKSASGFTSLPPGLYEFFTRVTGSTTKVIARTGVTLSPGRVYSISARGDITLPYTGTATNRPFLDNTLNR